MTINRRAIVCGFIAAGIGIGGSTGFYVFIALTVVFPALCLVQSSRRTAYVVGLSYYGGSLWPLIPAVRNFFGREATPGLGLLLWSTSTVLLGLPWLSAWSINHGEAIWRAPLALLFSVVPPLGFIGWASPLVTAGILFPGTKWLGLAAILLLCGALVSHPKISWVAMIVGALVINVCYPGDPVPPKGWEAVDTNFAGLAHEAADPIFAYRAAEWIQNLALSSGSRVLIFPEAVVPLWTDATDLFWHQTLVSLAASGKTILVGAEIPGREQDRQGDQKAIIRYDFASQLEILRHPAVPKIQRVRDAIPASRSYRNILIMRGAESAEFYQRIPVPISMWKPFTPAGVPLNLSGRGTLKIAGQRAAILICYEQVIPWPVLASLLEQPTVVVSIANDYWATKTPIPQYQQASSSAWARLFHLPLLSAVNK